MKKLCILMLVLTLIGAGCSTVAVVPAMAGETERLEVQLTLKQTQLRAVNAEFRLAQELIRNLQAEAGIVNQEIIQIRTQLRAIEAAKEQGEKTE